MFIDWLSVQQFHGFAPLWAESELLSVDVESGELCWSTYAGRSEEGSFSSSLRVRSDGQLVQVSGNPSRWNREENLFGVSSVERGVEIYNGVLRGLGLPEFYFDDRTRLTPRRYARSDSLVRDGCVLKRVDVTENFSAGSARNAERSLHALRSFRHRNRAPVDRQSTLSWGEGSRFAMFKYYLKGVEMRAHRNRKCWSSYLDRVLEFVESEGVLRFEVSCKAEFLRRSGLDCPTRWDYDVMRSIVEGYSLHGRASASVGSMSDIAVVLEGLGLKPLRAQRCQEAALAYLAGCDMRSGRSPATFYRLRRDLLLVGIDIAAELNVSSLRFSVEEIKLTSLQEPAWYKCA